MEHNISVKAGEGQLVGFTSSPGYKPYHRTFPKGPSFPCGEGPTVCPIDSFSLGAPVSDLSQPRSLNTSRGGWELQPPPSKPPSRASSK